MVNLRVIDWYIYHWGHSIFFIPFQHLVSRMPYIYDNDLTFLFIHFGTLALTLKYTS